MANQIYVQGGIPYDIPPYEHQEYPKWLCRYLGKTAPDDIPTFEHICVESLEEHAALPDGWCESQTEARLWRKTQGDPPAAEKGKKPEGRV